MDITKLAGVKPLGYTTTNPFQLNAQVASGVRPDSIPNYTAPSVAPKAPVAPKPVLPKPITDLSGRFANVNGTIYDKTANKAFSTPEEFFGSAGVNSFDNLRFDTNFQPLQQIEQQIQTKPNDFSQFKDTTTPEQFLSSLSKTTTPQQEQGNELSRLYGNYLNAVRNQGEISPEEKKAKEDLINLQENARLGISGLEGQGRGIPLSLIRGQQGKLEEQAGIKEQTLQDRLANIMAENDRKRKAQLAGAELEYNFAKQKAEGQKPIEVSAGSSLIKYNPVTGKYEQAYSAPQAAKTMEVNGELVQVNSDGTITKLYGQPKKDTTLTEVNGQRVLVDNQTGQTLEVLGRADSGNGSALSDLNTQLKLLQIQQAQQNLNTGTATQQDTAKFASRITRANNALKNVEDKIIAQSKANRTWQGFVPNVFKSSETQEFESAKRTFINSVLRDESGASIQPSEFTGADLQYFPQVGDSAALVAEKRALRKTVEDDFIRQSGNAYAAPVTTTNTPSATGADWYSYLGK